MTYCGKSELFMQVAPHYSSPRHEQRSVILDEFVAFTGYERKYAIRLLLGPIHPPAPIRRPRAPHYGMDVQEALSVVWSAANGICAKRLVPFLPELIPSLERHGHLIVTDEVRAQLLELSPATVDRLLRPLRQPHGLSTTKPGRLLKHQIPVRTFTEWTDVKPGFLEGDLGPPPLPPSPPPSASWHPIYRLLKTDRALLYVIQNLQSGARGPRLKS